MSFLDEFLDILYKVILLSLIIILSPLILSFFILWLATNGFTKKCKYCKVCKLYSSQSETCNKNSGEYPVGMFEARPATCYIEMEKNHGHYK